MAAALTTVTTTTTTPWLPQDDFLLKESIEHGASLEALAKGAVEFSRKFTIKELQDRWLSLLYDPAVSTQAGARMAELEVLATRSKKVETDLGIEKRRIESIRSSYYSRKRVCKEPFYQGNLSFLMDNSFTNEGGGVVPCLENVLEDAMEGNFGIEDSNFDGLYNLCADDLGYDEFFASQHDIQDEQIDHNMAIDDQIICGTSGEQFRYSPSLPEEAAWKTMESMLLSETPDDGNDSIANDIPLLDQFVITDGNYTDQGTSRTDGYGADISDFKYKNENEMQIVDEGGDELDDTSFDGLHTLLLNTMEYVADEEVGTSTFDPRFPEYRDGVVCCVLNTEDTEIPCNDDIFPTKPPTSGSHRRAQNKTTATSSAKCASSMKFEPKSMKKSRSAHSLVDESNGVVNGSTEKHRVINKEYLGLCGHDVENSDLMIEANGGQTNDEGLNHEAEQISSDFAAPMLGEAVDDPASYEQEQFDESDADLPCFSDVESMILDMDLGLADDDPLCAEKITKYQQADAMKRIIRLEQSANSHMQRNMTSHGAFATLFGRLSKHYLKKTEVLLGRSTDDVHVDIDLTKEGRPKKISRRQASIKMNKDGTFCLRNMGRCPIYVNSEKLDNGQCIDLLSGCLIEIRGMPFIFEVNQQRVKKYLDNAAR